MNCRCEIRVILGLLVVWGATAPLPFTVRAAEQSPVSTAVSLDEVSRALAQAKTVFTHFVQERHLSLFKEPLRSEGYLCFQQPGRIRWEVTEPYKSILLSDGSGVAQFEWVDERWKKLDIGLAAALQNVISQIAAVMQGSYARRGGDYQVTLAQTDLGPVVTLVPGNEKMRKVMKAIEVHLAADLKATRRVVLREQTGDFTDIQFDQQTLNVHLREGTFDRKAPLSLDAVRLGATSGSR